MHSIAGFESNHTTDIDNMNLGVKFKVDPSKFAYGKSQFTAETLRDYGIVTFEQREAFKKNP